MQLVADRFVAVEDGRAFDLVTGDRVVVRVEPAGGVREQARWSVRCDSLHRLRHRRIAPLIDFGLIGVSERFEAWGCGERWTGSPDEAERTHATAATLLRAIGLTPTAGSTADCVCRGLDGAVVLPDASTGYPCERDETAAATLPLEARAMAKIPRPAVAALAELFRGDPGARPHVVALWGPAGTGKTAVVHDVARIARAHGFVPVSSRYVASAYAELWRGRHLLIVEEDAAAIEMGSLLHAALGTAYGHVLILTMRNEPRGLEGIPIDRVDAGRLMAAIEPPLSDARIKERIRRAAADAKGVPARFVRAIWPPVQAPQSGLLVSRSRVAESTATFDAGDQLTEVSPASDGSASWPAPGELAALRRRMRSALEDARSGRYVRAMRQIRQTVGALARRGEWAAAGLGSVELARLLLVRGQPQEALAALEETRRFARQSRIEPALVDAAMLAGEARIDLARLDEAESVLGAAIAAARTSGDAVRAATARIALARAVFWRGRYADAASTLSDLREAADWPPALRLRYRLLGARIAVGQAEYSRAMSLLGEALHVSGGSALLVAAVRSTAAFVHLAVGDLDGVDREAGGAVAAARAAHDPLRSLRARILVAEADRRRGRTASSLTRLKRLGRAAVPPIVRLRCELIAALAAAPRDDGPRIVERQVSGSGLRALELFAPRGEGGAAALAGSDASVDHILAIVALCQTAEDEQSLLKNVCGRVRGQLHAGGVAFFSASGRGCELLAGDGARIDPAIVDRAVAAGTSIAPHQLADRFEAAAAVRYGGQTIGALAARWAPGSMYDRSRASTVLTVAAAAAAPVVSAAVARRSRDGAPVASDIRGVTPAIRELRQYIERAAAAPFSVLVSGESGSGKELVARAIHRAGPRRDRPFCALNCAALPDDLVEAELFGHARGAFTGAVVDRAGVFEEAHGGTLFLDEIGELSPRAQAKVLRVIQDGELRRVGENAPRRVDVRLVSATNRDLSREVAAGRFRLDLLYRLDVIRIAVPPLRERREDIAVLAEYLWQEATGRIGSRATLGAATLAALSRYDWPGNVRELQNVLAALAVRSPKRGVVPPTALPRQFGIAQTSEAWRLDQARRIFDEQFVRAALVRSGGRRGRAAAELGVTRQGLTKLMTRLGIAE